MFLKSSQVGAKQPLRICQQGLKLQSCFVIWRLNLSRLYAVLFRFVGLEILFNFVAMRMTVML